MALCDGIPFGFGFSSQRASYAERVCHDVIMHDVLQSVPPAPWKYITAGRSVPDFDGLWSWTPTPPMFVLVTWKKNVTQILTWFTHIIYVNLNYLIYLYKWKEINTLKRYNLIGIYLSSSYILQFIVNNCHCSIILISIWTGHYTLLSYHSGSRDPAYHYNDVIMSASSTVLLKSPASRLFTQPFIQAQIKENFKVPPY